MEEQAQQQNSSKEKKELLTHDFTIMGTPFKVTVSKGAKLSDVMKEFMRQHPLAEIAEYSIMCNARQIEKNKDGSLKEDPILMKASVISLLKKLSGGF